MKDKQKENSNCSKNENGFSLYVNNVNFGGERILTHLGFQSSLR